MISCFIDDPSLTAFVCNSLVQLSGFFTPSIEKTIEKKEKEGIHHFKLVSIRDILNFSSFDFFLEKVGHFETKDCFHCLVAIVEIVV